MKKIIIAIMIFGFSGALFAGTVKSVNGKVDVLIGGSWTPAKVGMSIASGTRIMSGLGGTMRVATATGYFTVNELSMVTFNESAVGGSTDTKLDLKMGEVQVRYKKVPGVKTSFKVQTPKGTASVRGTEEVVSYYPFSGMLVRVLEGIVDVGDETGNSAPATQGQSMGVSGDGSLSGNDDAGNSMLGENDRFTDNDALNDVVNNVLRQFLIDPFRIIQLGDEPERL